jgi:hypothetical protein
MERSPTFDLREQIGRYLAVELTIRDFHRWVLPASWNLHQADDSMTKEQAGEIGLCLAEMEAGHRTEDDFRRLLRGIREMSGVGPESSP